MIVLFMFAIAGYSPIGLFNITPELCKENGFDPQTNDPFLELAKCDLIYLLKIVGVDNDFNKYYRNKCATRSQFNNCIAKPFSIINQCVNKEDRKLAEIWKKIDVQILDYICENQLEQVAFVEEEIKCWDQGVEDALKYCSKRMYNTLSKSKYRELGAFTCSEFEDVEQCMRSSLPKKYCSEKSSDVIASTIKIIGKNVCKNSIIPKRRRRSVTLRRFVRSIAMGNKMQKIEHKVKNLCVSKGHASEKLEETLEELKICLREKQIFVVPKHEYLSHMDKCSKKAIELFKSCLPDEYKYLPPLFFDILESVVSFLYDDFIIIGSELSPCMPKLQSAESTAEYEMCVNNIASNVEEELVDSKEKFCKSWIPINECFVKQLKKDCKASTELTKLENDYMKAIERPCEKK